MGANERNIVVQPLGEHSPDERRRRLTCFNLASDDPLKSPRLTRTKNTTNNILALHLPMVRSRGGIPPTHARHPPSPPRGAPPRPTPPQERRQRGGDGGVGGGGDDGGSHGRRFGGGSGVGGGPGGGGKWCGDGGPWQRGGGEGGKRRAEAGSEGTRAVRHARRARCSAASLEHLRATTPSLVTGILAQRS